MIFSIGFDPFVQNLVHYVPHYREDPSQVSLLASTRGYNTVGPLLGGDSTFQVQTSSISCKVLTEDTSLLR